MELRPKYSYAELSTWELWHPTSYKEEKNKKGQHNRCHSLFFPSHLKASALKKINNFTHSSYRPQPSTHLLHKPQSHTFIEGNSLTLTVSIFTWGETAGLLTPPLSMSSRRSWGMPSPSFKPHLQQLTAVVCLGPSAMAFGGTAPGRAGRRGREQRTWALPAAKCWVVLPALLGWQPTAHP